MTTPAPIIAPVSGSLGARLKANAKRTKLGVISGRIAVERSRDVRRILGQRDGPMGATHRRFELGQSIAYVRAVFEDYLTYGGLERADLEGKRVLELGPGDSLGVSLQLVAAGASVVATDRFVPYRDPEHERRVYTALIECMPEPERRRVEPVVANDFESVVIDGIDLRLLEETPIERAPAILGEAEFDLIVSRAVLEHVHDLPTAFDSMDQLLAPGGRMIHKVDLRDHNLFTGGGQHPLTFLTINDRVYGWMGEESAGLPNRQMLGWYQRKLAELGYEADYLITHLAGVEEELEPLVPLEGGLPRGARLDLVREIRPRLLPRFRGLDDEELAIAGFMIVARKPPA